LRRHRSDVLPFTAPVWLAAPLLTWLFGHFAPMRTAMEAHANPEELRAVCRDTLAEARRLGVSVPRLEAAEPYFAAATSMARRDRHAATRRLKLLADGRGIRIARMHRTCCGTRS
jgi:hypothetical protein